MTTASAVLTGCRRRFAPLAGLMLCLWAALAPAFAQTLTFPALSGRVVDSAGILTADGRERIALKLAEHETKTSDQIVVATVPSLQGTSIEDYANRLFRTWKLGQAKTNNGVLLIIAPNDRKVRIEVGYGLEGSLTDAISKLIISGVIAPKFKAGNFTGGVEDGVNAIVATLQGDSEWQERLKLRNQSAPEEYDPFVVFLIFLVLVILFVNLTRNNRPGGGNHRRRNGQWIVFGPGNSSGGSWSSGSGGGSWGGGGGFSGGGGSSGGGGASGDW